jgi:DNA-directed RNA polymerase alpha subunit
MTDFEQFMRVVGAERILKLLQEVAKEAIDVGDWSKVRQITDLVEQITGHPMSMGGETNSSPDSPQAQLKTLNISNRCLELLNKAGLYNVTDLERYSLEDLLEINGIGEFAAKQIDNALQAQDITLDSVRLRKRWANENSALAEDLDIAAEGDLAPDFAVDESDLSSDSHADNGSV